MVNDLFVCVQHQRPLVQLWTENDRRKRFDFQSRLKETLPDLLEGKLDRPRQNVTDYDYWLRDRLDGCQDNTWLADRPLYAAVTLCRLIGAELGEETHVYQLGFEVVRGGKDAIRDALQRLVDMRINRSGAIRKTSGKIYNQFVYSESDDAALDILQHLTRECILENWAIALDTNVLGEVLRVRRLNSVVSAGNEAVVDLT